MEISQSENAFSDEILDLLKSSTITYTDSYAEDAETATLLKDLADDLSLSNFRAIQKSGSGPESIEIVLYIGVATGLVVNGITAGFTKLVTTLREIQQKRKAKQQDFSFTFTVRSVSADDIKEFHLHETNVSENDILTFLTEGLVKANKIADAYRADGGEHVAVTIECSNGKITINRVLGRGVGYIDFAPYLEE